MNMGLLSDMQSYLKAYMLAFVYKYIYNCKINIRTGFLDTENVGKTQRSTFYNKILRKLCGTDNLPHLA